MISNSRECPICGIKIDQYAATCFHCGSELKPEDRVDSVVDVNNLLDTELASRYRILEVIGVGGMATVYKAVQLSLDRFVALKVLHPYLSTDREFIMRFHREAKLSASLNHPNIVKIYDIDSFGQWTFYAMEHLKRNTLAYLLRRNEKLIINRVIKIICHVARALAYIHDRGLVHRDLKPSNIFITSGLNTPILLDFGLVYAMQETRFSQAGTVIGTPGYMSPEQIKASDYIDYRSDIFNLGTLLYECLSGMNPFGAGDIFTTLHRIEHSEYPSLKRIIPDIDPKLEELIGNCLNSDPDDRTFKAVEIANILENLNSQKGRRGINYNHDDDITESNYSRTFYIKPSTQNQLDNEEDPVIDIEGNSYRTVRIGSQVWMAENLRVTHYNNGTPISQICAPDKWKKVLSGAYCWHDNNPKTKFQYGAIYNRFAVNSGILSPDHWRIPRAEDYHFLFDLIKRNWGSLLREGYLASDYDSNNITGFSSGPTAMHLGDKTFVSYLSTYWCTSELIDLSVHFLYPNIEFIVIPEPSKYCLQPIFSGMPVRCIKC